jgi:hypothetical protein
MLNKNESELIVHFHFFNVILSFLLYIMIDILD